MRLPIVMLLIPLAGTTARADPPRLAAGVALGAAAADCDTCAGSPIALAAAAEVGVRLSPRLALGADMAVDVSLDEGGRWSTITTAYAQAWLMPRLWLRGGLGALIGDVPGGTRPAVPAAALTVGTTVVDKQKWVLEFQIRADAAIDGDGLAYGRCLGLFGYAIR